MEHHSNIVPWQMICEERDATFASCRSTTPASSAWTSSIGCCRRGRKSSPWPTFPTPWARSTRSRFVIEHAHALGIPVLIDGAQAVPHMPVDVQALDCDFYAFSGHKIYGPTGIGILYGKAEHLELMPPYQGGGDMIRYRQLREDDLQRAAVQVRGRHASDRPGYWAGGGRGFCRGNRPRRASPLTSSTCWNTPPSVSRISAACRIIGTAAAQGGGHLVCGR